MAGRSALGGFVEGLSGGMKFRQDAKRQKLLDRAIGYRLADLQRKEHFAFEDAAQGGYDTSQLPRGADIAEDPYDFSLKNWWGNIKQNFKNSPAGRLFHRSPKSSKTLASPRSFDDGGFVQRYLPNTYKEYIRRTALDPYYEADIENAETAADKGRAIRNKGGHRLESNIRYVGALGDDLLGPVDEYVADVGRGIGGFFGFGTTPDDTSQPTQATPVPDTSSAQSNEPSDTEARPARPATTSKVAIAIDDVPTSVPKPTQSQTQAILPSPKQFDWSEVQQVDPAGIPSMPTRDWQEYRKRYVATAGLRGLTPAQAHEQISAIQHQGFRNHAAQAMQLLQANEWQRAAMALRAAYQYFPNGVDVQFGMVRDSSGQPALVGMGRSEDTGQRVGQPILITPERLSVMIDNFSDPSAFRAWTKDWRDEAFARQRHDDARRINAYRAETDRMNLANRLRASVTDNGSGGLNDNDIRTVAKEFRDELDLMSLDPKQAANARKLAAIMAGLYVSSDAMLDPNRVIDLVMSAYEGDQEALNTITDFGIVVPRTSE